MKAVVHDRYGGPEVLRLEDVERPTPGDDDLLVRVHATTVNRTDCGARSGTPLLFRLFLGARRPKRRVRGMEFAGTVEAAGSNVSEFKPGARVFGVKGHGAHAEYLRVRATGPVAHLPPGVTFAQGAPICDGAGLALACLRAAGTRPGQRLLVYGASGATGTAAIQLAKHLGAEVTAVCSTRHVALVRSLGADTVIDYTQEDFVSRPERYDAVVDAYGKLPVLRSRRALDPGGVYVATDAERLWLVPFLMLFTRTIGNKPVKMAITRFSKLDVLYLGRLVESGAFRPVIDRTYPLDQVVEATRYVETGRKTGNVVLTLASH